MTVFPFDDDEALCLVWTMTHGGGAFRHGVGNILFFAEDEELVQSIFHSAFDFVSRVPVSQLTFVPDARVWELIR